MRRTGALLRPHPCAGWPLLMLSFFWSAGCSEGSRVPPPGSVAARFGLEPSEFIALKKSGMKPGGFNDAVTKKKIAEMQDKGIVVKTTRQGKSTNKSR